MTDDVSKAQWRSLTQARIGLGRTGASLPTRAVLDFALDHARARDAVHTALDVEALGDQMRSIGFEVLNVTSVAADRHTYLARPDLGARLSAASRDSLAKMPQERPDLVIVLADGLSSHALDHASGLLGVLKPTLSDEGWVVSPVVIATQARVALGDEIGECLKAAMVLVLIGERPGMSSPDSLGAYLTWNPKVGRTNAERNCVSNIRPEGLPPEAAADTLLWLMGQARQRALTGIDLKDLSGLTTISSSEALA